MNSRPKWKPVVTVWAYPRKRNAINKITKKELSKPFRHDDSLTYQSVVSQVLDAAHVAALQGRVDRRVDPPP